MLQWTFVALCLVPGAVGFSPGARLFGAPLSALPRAPVSRPTVFKPLAAFGGGKKEQAPSESEVAKELATHYRTLGVPMDATFERIAEQTDLLKSKYTGDMKKVKMIEIAKDRIMELKLQQRMQGSLAVSSGAVEYDTSREAWEKRGKKRKLPPPLLYISRMYCPPNKQELQRFAIYFGGAAAVGIGLPRMSSAVTGLSCMLAVSMLYSRGAGLKFSRSPEEAYSAQAPELKWKFVGVSVLTVMGGWLLGNAMLMSLVELVGPFLMPGTPQFSAVASNIGYFLVCSFLRVNPAAMVQKRKRRRR